MEHFTAFKGAYFNPRRNDVNPRDFLLQSKTIGFSRHRQSSTVSSLPEDVKSIQSALEGASREAKDATLKVLSKLIQRLEQAELDRDNAISKYLSYICI